MPQQMFAYEARNEQGQSTAGTILADSLEQAGQLLSQQNLFVLRLNAKNDTQANTNHAQPRASRAEVVWFISQLSIMVETGIHLNEALECLSKQSQQPRLRALLSGVAKHVQEGSPLSEAMSQYPKAFPSSLIALIRASEMSGTMTHVLNQASQYLMNDMKVIKRLRSALLYPAFILLTCLSVTVFLLIAILPRFADVFASRGAVLPAPTQMLMNVSNSLIFSWHLWLAGVITVCLGMWIWFRTDLGIRQKDYLLITVPPLANLFNTLHQSRAFRTLGLLMDAGVPVLDAMQIMGQVVPNTYYRQLWQEIDERIQHGERFAGPLVESPLIPDHLAQMVESGDRSGRLGMVCSRLAEHLEEEYDRAIKAVTQFIEPCMILVMGGLVGYIVAAVMLPLFQAGQVVAN